jgi:hypothetical protein
MTGISLKRMLKLTPKHEFYNFMSLVAFEPTIPVFQQYKTAKPLKASGHYDL